MSLVTERPDREERAAREGEELVTVATFGDVLEASVARGALEAEGMPAFVPGEGAGVLTINRSEPQLTWAELKVRAKDRDRAVELLKRAGHR